MNLLAFLSHYVIFPILMYKPICELSFMNPYIKAISGGNDYDQLMDQTSTKIDFLKSKSFSGQVCVYYRRLKFTMAKTHMIMVKDGSKCAVYKYGPPNTGYYPLEEPIEHRFIASDD